MGNPYNDVDLDLFYAATTITIGNGNISLFGTLLGYLEKSQKTLRPFSSMPPLEKTGMSNKLFITLLGFPRSRWMSPYLFHTIKSILRFGTSSNPFTSKRRLKTLLFVT
jgi:hypothetical protein